MSLEVHSARISATVNRQFLLLTQKAWRSQRLTYPKAGARIQLHFRMINQNRRHLPYILESNPNPFLQFQRNKKSDAD